MAGFDKQVALKTLADSIHRCTRCALHRSRVNAVPGEGSEEASIMLIGEAPGYYEDQAGRPFVGAAGRLLTHLLARAGLTREEVFITNVVKCRPPNNRDPRPEEIRACLPYLKQQIEIIDPRVIVTLGRHALQVFWPGAKISRVHGQVHRRHHRWMVPMYHPAVALYRKDMRAILEEDFRRFGRWWAAFKANSTTTEVNR